MKDLSRMEKIALGLILLILVIVVIQVTTRFELFNLGLPGVIPQEFTELDTQANLLKRDDPSLTASSHNQENEAVDRLTDNNPDTFWHVAVAEIGKPASLTVDFGPEETKTIRALAARPRADIPRQFLRQAELSGSEDGSSWQPVAVIVLRDVPEKANWRKWDFANDRAYRFWRLRIINGHEDGVRYNFLSMAELALFE